MEGRTVVPLCVVRQTARYRARSGDMSSRLGTRPSRSNILWSYGNESWSDLTYAGLVADALASGWHPRHYSWVSNGRSGLGRALGGGGSMSACGTCNGDLRQLCATIDLEFPTTYPLRVWWWGSCHRLLPDGFARTNRSLRRGGPDLLFWSARSDRRRQRLTRSGSRRTKVGQSTAHALDHADEKLSLSRGDRAVLNARRGAVLGRVLDVGVIRAYAWFR